MPITQDRMLNLISAAQEYDQAWKDLSSAIEGAIAEQEQTGDAKNALLGLRASILATTPTTQSAVVVALEQQHFRHFAKINTRSKLKQQRRRADGQRTQKTLEEMERYKDSEPDLITGLDDNSLQPEDIVEGEKLFED